MACIGVFQGGGGGGGETLLVRNKRKAVFSNLFLLGGVGNPILCAYGSIAYGFMSARWHKKVVLANTFDYYFSILYSIAIYGY